MTDDELKKLVAGLAADSAKIHEAQKATDEQMKRTDEKLKRIGIMLGNIGRNQGDVAEEFFYNSLIKDLHLGGIEFDGVTKNMKRHHGKIREEYDLLLTNSNIITVIEVKYKAHLKDLDKLDRKVINFKKLFPIYKDFKLYGGMASFNFNDDTKEEALNRGYFILQRSGKIITTEGGKRLKTW